MKTADPPRPRTRPKRPGAPGAHRRRALPYLLIAPTMLALSAVLGYPLVKLVLLSFQDMTRKELFAGTDPPWVGFKQYRSIFTDAFFWEVVGRTALFTVVCVGLTMGVAMGVALLMRQVDPWVRVTMAGVLVAVWAMPIMVAAAVFRWLTDTDYGVVNWALGLLPGADFTGHNWFANPWHGFTVIVLVVVWGAVPFATITLHAALTQVPAELEEAARVDGARGWQLFRCVTFPVIKPAFVMVTALMAIWDFGVFNQIWLMRGGQPEKEYYLLGVYSFTESFAVNRYSSGAAIAVITVLLLLVGAVVYLRQLLRMGEVE
ncbi:sugar ABC transporter permease [Streptomyces sp. N2-109]|uniref:Sugar ABC transporter permease n=1 Tax=Streptomyces gossypii TaxID=2883101 RepID=A0ABT2JV75_9ACTN|nr:sugar ABC transporter permease [Streptomyces gossypii]MCT2591770.1 sugar ABC transporter permease [Streptomyces gossypii]